MPRDFDQLDEYKEVQRLGGIPSLTLEDIQAQRALYGDTPDGRRDRHFGMAPFVSS